MLEHQINQLAVAIRDAVVERRRAGVIPTHRSARVKRRDFNLKFRGDLGFDNFPPERSDLEIWDLRDQEEFQGSFVREYGGYPEITAALGPKASRLDQFVRSVSLAAFNGVNDEELRAQVNSFCCQIEDKPMPVKVIAFLDGISIQGTSLRVSDSTVLRQPVQEDLTEVVYVDEYGGFNFPLAETWFRLIGDFVFDAVYTGQAQQEFLRTVEALRLFRVGGVATNRYRFESRHFMSGGLLYGAQRHSKFSYELSKRDGRTLGRFLKDIIPLLPDPFQMDDATTDVGIAHARYVDALFQTGPPERTITSAITSLEALFLRNEPELTHRLGQRTAMFLKLLGPTSDAKEIYSNMKEGYRIRSTFIHGGSLKTKDRPQASVLAPVIVEYARRCVLARLQQQSAISKDDLLAKLDESMIASSAARDVKRTFLKTIWR
jgi:hypothetical protein